MSLEAATREEVSRLFGRAAFGATPDDLARWTGRPYAEAVDHLVNVPAMGNRPGAGDEARRSSIEQGGRAKTQSAGGATAQAQMWWLERMRTTPYPLEERLTLFWHGHFATSVLAPFPDVAMMMAQNQTIRLNALGNFRTLVAAMTVDCAMLEWLDGARNTIPAPNENYAREFLELFTLGKYPQVYGEGDVREAARVLTGWKVDRLFRKVAFDAGAHDTGTKTILGATIPNQGANEYRTLIDVALAQPVSALFIAHKLVSNFGYAAPTTDLLRNADPLVARVAQSFRSTGWDIRAAMRTLLMSDEFRTGDANIRRQLVRQPAEIVVGAGKTLRFTLDNQEVVARMANMGQPLLVPPNVGGWPTGTGWLSPATVLTRYDFGMLAQGRATVPLPPAGDFDGWARLLGLAPPSATTTAALKGFLDEQSRADEPTKQASVLVLMLSTPEWAVI
ncbi:MAG: DUF1800 domain-containing protein [Actinobacteria bacterium]|nr:DUF1800 domain-containing protein [Actinomycetota bacterium]